MQKINLIGLSFGNWKVIYEAAKVGNSKRAFWLCECKCGNQSVVNGYSLKSGLSTRCKNCANKTHGHSHKGNWTPEYTAWVGMKTRCSGKGTKDYCGKSNISICKRWENSFENFLNDMGLRPSPKHSIDRIDTNDNYKPSNCRWATRDVQDRNKTNNIWVKTPKGFFVLKDALEQFQLKYNAFYKIRNKGFSNQDSFNRLLERKNGN